MAQSAPVFYLKITIRLDPTTASPSVPPFWVLAAGALNDAEAAFQAGDTLGSLDTRGQPGVSG